MTRVASPATSAAPLIPSADRKQNSHYQPPYMTPVPNARVGFNDLPMEVVMRIFPYVEKFHGLLLTCKRTCIPAGEMLYANGPVCVGNDRYLGRRLPSGRRGKGARLVEVMRGLEEKGGATPQRPFGNALKRRFMAHMTSLLCHAISEKERSDTYLSFSHTHIELLELIGILDELIREEVEPFPALQEIVFTHDHDPDAGEIDISPYSVEWTGMVRQLASLCRPRSFEWSEQKLLESDAIHGDVRVKDLLVKVNSDPELRFAGGHLPDVVQHNVQHFPSCGLEFHPVPFPCYGTYNIVYVETLCVGDETKYGCAAYMEKVLEKLHPELSEEEEDEHDEEEEEEVELQPRERARRDATTWEFAWSAPSLFDLYFRPMEMLEEMLDEVWRMVLELNIVQCGRVRLSSPDIWRRRQNWDMEQEWSEWVENGENIEYPGWEGYWEGRMSDKGAKLDREIGERGWELAEQRADERVFFTDEGKSF
ncbi:hypothetical protein IAT38_002642 [Cryptococcus sp. DSM 104549]